MLRATRSTKTTGTLGVGTVWMLWANRSQSQRPSAIPSGTPTTVPIVTVIVDCQATAAASSRPGEPERLQQGKIAVRRRRTEASKVSARAAMAPAARPAPRKTGVSPSER